MTLKLGLVGLGKIATTQHLPAIAATEGVALAAIASRHARLPDLPGYPDIDTLLANEPEIDAISLCTPPAGRFDQARAALAAGKHVMLEKPPGSSISEVRLLSAMAEARGLTLFASWHSRMAGAVEPARQVLAGRTIRSVAIEWKEDVLRWHPGQEWIWQPGGLGVFDPGINALSIATYILPEGFFVEDADLYFPTNRAAPIAASLRGRTASGLPVTADFDWRQTGPQTWDITIQSDEGPVMLSGGGSHFTVDGYPRVCGEDGEYRKLYSTFVALVGKRASDVDLSPLVHVADAFLLGRHRQVEPFG
ncbi:Gfo/Idh/MocA family protein [Amaricoccus sp. W119]|jgi:D-galactose 1-dehydrogenase|uniref:Gfo/Idh/MocA family protein n=1 Tax=Amaricoccus sp. W119 TaxID=3391833 RepID=UPI0039A65FF3